MISDANTSIIIINCNTKKDETVVFSYLLSSKKVTLTQINIHAYPGPLNNVR